MCILITEYVGSQVFGSLLTVLMLICFGNSYKATALPGDGYMSDLDEIKICKPSNHVNAVFCRKIYYVDSRYLFKLEIFIGSV